MKEETTVQCKAEKEGESRVVITLSTEFGTMQNNIFLWPKEIFSINPEPPIKFEVVKQKR